MPIFLDALVPSWAAVLVSVTLVLVFGEVVPTALFTGHSNCGLSPPCALSIHSADDVLSSRQANGSCPDYFLGHDEDDEGYSREELSAMVRILRSKVQTWAAEVTTILSRRRRLPGRAKNTSSTLVEEEEEGDSDSDDSSDEEPLTANEVDVITGVLSLSKMTMLDLLTPLDQVTW